MGLTSLSIYHEKIKDFVVVVVVIVVLVILRNDVVTNDVIDVFAVVPEWIKRKLVFEYLYSYYGDQPRHESQEI